MGNTTSNSPRKPLSSNELDNESATKYNINESISNLQFIIFMLKSDNFQYNDELLKKQSLMKEYTKKNNMDAAGIVAKQIVRINAFLRKNLKTIEQSNALILKLQETKDIIEIKRLINESNLVLSMRKNPIIGGGEYMRKLIKYEDKLLGLY